jgi:hypothetical protein
MEWEFFVSAQTKIVVKLLTNKFAPLEGAEACHGRDLCVCDCVCV